MILLFIGVVFAIDCQPGKYLAGTGVCIPCTNGYFCPGGTNTFMLKCAPGTYSDFEQSTCTQCPAGHKCLDPANVPYPCPTGSYAPAGSADCIACSSVTTPGAVCTDDGLLHVCQPGDLCQ